MKTEYDYAVSRNLREARDVDEAVSFTVLNYMHDQLGWSYEECRNRVVQESERVIPKMVLDSLETRGWRWEGQRVLDVGAGQGGLVLELLHRKADAWGIEPGEEFLALSRLRLESAGYDVQRVLDAFGENIPFPNNYFDEVISLQVLEHVANPRLVLEEIYRVLKPGGCCHISCENYLSFFEPHYRVRWLPLLPKNIGAWYLRRIGRNPHFLLHYIFYTTYPQIWHLCRQVGFQNETYAPQWEKLYSLESIHRPLVRTLARTIATLPAAWARILLNLGLHGNYLLRHGVTVILRKPIGEYAS